MIEYSELMNVRRSDGWIGVVLAIGESKIALVSCDYFALSKVLN